MKKLKTCFLSVALLTALAVVAPVSDASAAPATNPQPNITQPYYGYGYGPCCGWYAPPVNTQSSYYGNSYGYYW